MNSKVDKLRSLYPSIAPEDVAGFAVDLCDKEHLEANLTALLDQATHKGAKKIDHIAFTAGNALPIVKIGDFDLATLADGFSVRLVAACMVAKVVANGEYMPRSASSSITLTGGSNTHRPMTNWALVAAIGASIEGLVRGLAVDLAPIRANAVIPGAIETELLEGFLAGSSTEAVEKMKKTASLSGEFGRPEDIAEAYGWVMKDRFVTGTMVCSDGGHLLMGTE